MPVTERSLRSTGPPVTPSKSSKGKKKEPPTKKPKTSKNDKDSGAYVTAEDPCQDPSARLLDLRDTLLGAFKEVKEDPPKPPAASESDEDSTEGGSSEEEAARHRKPAAGRTHHDLKALIDRANAALSGPRPR